MEPIDPRTPPHTPRSVRTRSRISSPEEVRGIKRNLLSQFEKATEYFRIWKHPAIMSALKLFISIFTQKLLTQSNNIFKILWGNRYWSKRRRGGRFYWIGGILSYFAVDCQLSVKQSFTCLQPRFPSSGTSFFLGALRAHAHFPSCDIAFFSRRASRACSLSFLWYSFFFLGASRAYVLAFLLVV